MSDGFKYAVYVIGFITMIYLIFRYIIPLLLRFIAGALGIFMQILLIALVIFGIIWVAGHISKTTNR